MILKKDQELSPKIKTPSNKAPTEPDVDSAFIEDDSGSFIALSPSVHPDDYMFSLDDSEGISELFDINATALPDSGSQTAKHTS